MSELIEVLDDFSFQDDIPHISISLIKGYSLDNTCTWVTLTFSFISVATGVSAEPPKSWTPLHDLAFGNTQSQPLEELTQRYDINTQDAWGATPMYVAAKHNSMSVLQDLINVGADLNIADKNGYLPMHIACYYGNHGAIKLLYEQEASLNAENAYKQNCRDLVLLGKNEGKITAETATNILAFINAQANLESSVSDNKVKVINEAANNLTPHVRSQEISMQTIDGSLPENIPIESSVVMRPIQAKGPEIQWIGNIPHDIKAVPSAIISDEAENLTSDGTQVTQIALKPEPQANMQSEELLKALYSLINDGSSEKVKIALATLSLKGFDLNSPDREGGYILEKLIHEPELNHIFKPIIQALLEWGANPHLHNSFKKLSAIASNDFRNLDVGKELYIAEELYSPLIFEPNYVLTFSLEDAYSLTKLALVGNQNARALINYAKYWGFQVEILDSDNGLRSIVFYDLDKAIVVFNNNATLEEHLLNSTDVNMKLVEDKLHVAAIQVHQDFKTLLDSIWNNIGKFLQEDLAACRKTTWFTGYAAAGAIASIAAAHFADECFASNKVLATTRLYTFGSSRPGDNNFAELVYRLTGGCAYNIMSACDPITLLPAANSLYKAFGQIWYFDTKGYLYSDHEGIQKYRDLDYKKEFNKRNIVINSMSFDSFRLVKQETSKTVNCTIENNNEGKFKWPECEMNLQKLDLSSHSLESYMNNLKNALLKINNDEFITNPSHNFKFIFDLHKVESNKFSFIKNIATYCWEIAGYKVITGLTTAITIKKYTRETVGLLNSIQGYAVVLAAWGYGFVMHKILRHPQG